MNYIWGFVWNCKSAWAPFVKRNQDKDLINSASKQVTFSHTDVFFGNCSSKHIFLGMFTFGSLVQCRLPLWLKARREVVSSSSNIPTPLERYILHLTSHNTILLYGIRLSCWETPRWREKDGFISSNTLSVPIDVRMAAVNWMWRVSKTDTPLSKKA